ncbi:unnamed protein product [Ambrosiozyma monospora]|uniref:Unnamed protein product n=1 Tax=Ambrosiozyma monospora TaxID=43982 RepID=A0ACB5TCP6_AMBMO|nr:unnamed protein product [Ambrosiozyma monospora]
MDYKSSTTTATTTTTATVPPEQFSDSRNNSIQSLNGGKLNLKSPNFNNGVFNSASNVQSPIHFELPQHAHPLQHFSFHDENAIHQQTDELAGLGFNVTSGSNLHTYPTHAVSSPTTTVTPTSPFTSTTRTNSIKRKAPPKAVVSDPVGPIVPFTEYLSKEDDRKIHILIGATGSVATIKIPLIIDKLFKIYGADKVSIQLVVTRAAEHFLRGLKISTEVKIWRENEEWSSPMTRPGDPILHVELRKWADILLIAPMSANTLAKITNGFADNLLTSIVRVWNPTIPILIAPAMNTYMYAHPVTKKQLKILSEDFKYVEVLKPIEKVLICGDIGMGGMREWSEIVDIVVNRLKVVLKKKKELMRDEGIVDEEDDVLAEEDEDEDDEDEDDDDDDNDDDDEDDDDDDDDDEDEDDDDESDDVYHEANSPTLHGLNDVPRSFSQNTNGGDQSTAGLNLSTASYILTSSSSSSQRQRQQGRTMA